MFRNILTRIVITCRACNSFSKPLPGKFWLPFGVVQSLTLLPANSVVGVVTLDTMAVCQCDNSRNVRAISANSATCSATVQRTKTESSWANCSSKTTVDYRPKINEITDFFTLVMTGRMYSVKTLASLRGSRRTWLKLAVRIFTARLRT